ncbi:DNA internalization-related competence protein ComEC/Rec2 [Nesterenkonia lutea]|uniref:Competence protein ComEC n=1 Tax=Nesterenkonia lutea TaxID=272919 RepID=A0ABR9JDL2_9MICC|nr:DNA internalization-related competence protein ComEC/Rec2 [Nesterenkonia lutea]MBE1524020.1 competence protein ComEC [Nesterenkonia lutea]
MTSRPLDLRLLPAALAAWASALAAVHLPWAQALQLGWTLVVAGVLLTLTAWLLNRLFTDPTPLHVLLCCVVAGLVALTVGADARELSARGWHQAVESEAPVTVTLRVTGQPQLLSERGFGGAEQVLGEAVVEQAIWTDREVPSALDASVVIIEELTGPDLPFTAGRRYQGLAQLTPAENGQRATAVVFPYGEQLEELPADRWTDVAEVFNGLRTATAEASSHALGDAPGLLPGLILGDRSLQDAELSEAMREAGLSHLTAVSGANCALVMGSLMGLVRLLRLPRWSAVPVALIGLVLFVLLVHPEPSVIRAGVMGSVAALSLFAGRGRSAFSLLCLCVVGLLIFDPYYATEPAFQLSAAATAGIVVIGTPLRQRLQRVLPALLAAPLALAFSAQLFVTPVLLPLAAGVNTYAVPANVLAAPFVPFVTVPGTFAAVISTLLPSATTAILWCCGLAAACLGLIGRAASSLPQALAPWPEGWVGVALTFFYIGAAVVLVVGLVGRLRRWQAGVLAAAAGAVLAVVLPAAVLAPTGLPASWRVALCDVGQGDMLVVRTQESAGIVVDAGEEPDLARDCLERLQINTVEALLFTHEHRDHYGGAEGVIATDEPAMVLYSSSEEWVLDVEVEAVAALPESVTVHRARPGDTLHFAQRLDIRLRVWSADTQHPEANDNSLVAVFEIGDPELPAAAVGSLEDPLTLLTTGDLEEEAAAAMMRSEGLPEEVHLLKVAHHGAANGGTELLQATRPGVALIGVGEDNRYGHPSTSILDALADLGAAVYRTDVHGTVVITADAEGLDASAVP